MESDPFLSPLLQGLSRVSYEQYDRKIEKVKIHILNFGKSLDLLVLPRIRTDLH
jgi:hypothetical protein